MLSRSLATTRDVHEPRRWDYVWRDAPGFFGLGYRKCKCCGTGGTTKIVSYSGTSFGQAHAETYDPVGNAWTATGNPAHPSGSFGDTNVDGVALMAFVGTIRNLADEWAGSGWVAIGNPPTNSLAAIQQGPSTIPGTIGWIFGGIISGTTTAVATNYSTNTSTWATNTAMPATKGQGRGGTITATVKSYAFMGTTGSVSQTPTTSCYEYDQVGDSWATTGSGSHARYSTGSFALDSVPAVFIVGGFDNVNLYTLNEEFSGGSFTTRAAYYTFIEVSRGDQVTSLSAGFMNGGNDVVGAGITNTNNEYVIDTWTSKTAMANVRSAHGCGAF